MKEIICGVNFNYKNNLKNIIDYDCCFLDIKNKDIYNILI